jgi:hypothetical protein
MQYREFKLESEPLKPQLITADHSRRSEIAPCGSSHSRVALSLPTCCGDVGAV